YLTVSMGQQSVKMPGVVGLPYREAQIQLLSQGLRLGQVLYKYSDSVPAGAVLWQSVPGQTSVPAGTIVDVVVSQGPRPSVTVPSLSALSLEEAERVLTSVGLRLGTISYLADATFLPNTVVTQSPSAGMVVPPGTPVSVTVAR
ncbi:MAG: PASTA domain-containing protein, partial [Candidatus Kapabacteria bacterium]|nr:PASTA domain-containing protein [Candidatus Kapabacteria bacterium]